MSSTATQELLIEILTEELPAIPFLKEWNNIAQKWEQALAQFHIQAPCELHYTPRRISIYSRAFPTHSTPLVQEVYGPPLDIAYINGDKAQGLSPAGLGFCKKVGIEADKLLELLDSSDVDSGKPCRAKSTEDEQSRKVDPRMRDEKERRQSTNDQAASFAQIVEKDGKRVLFLRKIQAGLESKDIVGEAVVSFVRSLHFGKSMRWGEVGESFIRPIRNIMLLLDGKSITADSSVQGTFAQSGLAVTLLHRSYSAHEPRESTSDTMPCIQESWVQITGLDDYLHKLENGGVILDANARKQRILHQIRDIESAHQVQVEVDSALLAQIVAITEYPTALLGGFDKRFLTLPEEVITTSMKEHQKYFSVRKNGRLYQGFVVVANALCKDFSAVISGNERVLKARLSDAEFFYKNDCATPLTKDPLAHIAYIDGLGSMLDKTMREECIGAYLSRLYGQDVALITQAIAYSKADLLSEMVGEFPELQGIMGYYYALAQGFSQEISQAIKEQYLPSGEDSTLPSSKISAIVALSGKLENLIGLFSIGKSPSGSKDPFALRRAANGVIKIILEWQLAFDVKQILVDLATQCHYDISRENLAHLQGFIIERLESVLGVSAQIFRSASMGLSTDLCTIASNAKALESLLLRDNKEAIVAVFKRVANITKDIQPNQKSSTSLQQLDTTLFTPQESALYEKFLSLHLPDLTTPQQKLDALFSLKNVLEEFFANVLVNDENPALRHNRKSLLYAIYAEFCTIGDLKELAL